VPEFDLVSWTVMLAPKGTPADIVGLVRKETLAALDDPKVTATLARQGVEKSRSQDVRAFLKSEYDKFGRAVRTLGLKMGE
jgi:tripartite-type tricarboxylate transporter receptor subunit TctC